MITLTIHARAQMRLRGITLEEIMAVITRPEETAATRANRLASYASLRGTYIVVIYERQKDEDVIVCNSNGNEGGRSEAS